VIETADVVVIGAGVQGASLAFHLARRGAAVVVVERSSVASGATGRSSGFVRMHYDVEAESRLAWASLPYFRDWAEQVGEGSCDFVHTGFVQLVPPSLADALRANVAMHRRVGIDASLIGPDDVARLLPGVVTDDVEVAAYEPLSGYADPTATASGFLTAARRAGARYVGGAQARVVVERDRVVAVESDKGRIATPVAVDAAGAWAAEVAASAGVEVPVEAWRHDTAYFGLPVGRDHRFPIVIDQAHEVYFRPEGRDLMLVGLEAGNTIGRDPRRDGGRDLRPAPVDGGRDAAHRARRPGRDRARPARDPRRGRARRLLPRLRALRDRVQDGPGGRPLPLRAHPGRRRADGGHLGLLSRPLRGRPADRARAPVRAALAVAQERAGWSYGPVEAAALGVATRTGSRHARALGGAKPSWIQSAVARFTTTVPTTEPIDASPERNSIHASESGIIGRRRLAEASGSMPGAEWIEPRIR
jgi:glycine/D-amino acid oxidase-like deaminating enzyme